MPADQPNIRIGDAEREVHVSVLGEHLASGRLTMTEFEDRLDDVYRATTQDQLDEVLADSPRTVPARPLPRPDPVRRSPPAAWVPWAVTGAICLLVWIATSLAHGEPLGFWPVWVIGPWGLVLIARTVAGHGGTAACNARRR